MLLWQIAGTCLSIAGIYALYLSWRRKQRSWSLVLAGWGTLLAAIWAWGKTSGVDKGPAIGIVVTVLIAMVAVLIVALRTPTKERREPRSRNSVVEIQRSVWHKGLSTTFSVIAIVFAGLMAAISACTALFMGGRALGMEHTANLTATMIAFPLVWAALAVFIGYTQSIGARAGMLTGLMTVSIAIIAVALQGA